MKAEGSGGAVYVDEVLVAHVTSWSINEAAGDIDMANSTRVTGDIAIHFDDSESEHAIAIGTIVDIEIKPHADAVTNWTLTDCRILSRQINGEQDSMVSGRLSFESLSAVTYP